MRKAIKTMVIATMLTLTCFVIAFARDPNNQSSMNLGRRVSSSNQITRNQEDSQRTCTLNSTGGLLKSRWLTVHEKNDRCTTAEFYYLDGNGIMQTDWLDDQSQTFYLEPDGRVVQGKCAETIDGQDYVFDYQNLMLKNRNTAIDGKNYNANENGRVISNITDEILENPFPSGQSDQLTHLNTYRRQKGMSDLFYDSDLTGVTKAAHDYSSSITLSEVYSLASTIGHNIRHAAFIRTTAIDKESYVYLTEDVAAIVQNTWFTRVECYKNGGTITIIMAAYDQEEASILSADGAQDKQVDDNGYCRYRKVDGSYAANCWVKNPGDGRWYHFDENSCTQTRWFRDSGGKWYYLSTDTEEMLTNIMADECVIGEDGVMVSGP